MAVGIFSVSVRGGKQHWRNVKAVHQNPTPPGLSLLILRNNQPRVDLHMEAEMCRLAGILW